MTAGAAPIRKMRRAFRDEMRRPHNSRRKPPEMATTADHVNRIEATVRRALARLRALSSTMSSAGQHRTFAPCALPMGESAFLLVPWKREALHKSRSAAPGWQGAKSE